MHDLPRQQASKTAATGLVPAFPPEQQLFFGHQRRLCNLTAGRAGHLVCIHLKDDHRAKLAESNLLFFKSQTI